MNHRHKRPRIQVPTELLNLSIPLLLRIGSFLTGRDIATLARVCKRTKNLVTVRGLKKRCYTDSLSFVETPAQLADEIAKINVKSYVLGCRSVVVLGPIVKGFEQQLVPLRSLTIGCPLKASQLTFLKTNTSVRTLHHLSLMLLRDDPDMALLHHLTQLRTLQLQANDPTSFEIAAPLTTLTSLSLSANLCPADEDFTMSYEWCHPLTSLRRLILPLPANVSHLETLLWHLTQLTALDLRWGLGIIYGDYDYLLILRGLPQRTQLKHLTLNEADNSLTQFQHQHQLKEFTRLETLSLAYQQIFLIFDALPPVNGFPYLRTLNLDNCNFLSPRGHQYVYSLWNTLAVGCPALSTLKLEISESVVMANLSLVGLCTVTSLTSLHLSHMITTTELIHILECQTLRSLHFKNLTDQLDERYLFALTQMPHMQSIKLLDSYDDYTQDFMWQFTEKTGIVQWESAWRTHIKNNDVFKF